MRRRNNETAAFWYLGGVKKLPEQAYDRPYGHQRRRRPCESRGRSSSQIRRWILLLPDPSNRSFPPTPPQLTLRKIRNLERNISILPPPKNPNQFIRPLRITGSKMLRKYHKERERRVFFFFF